MSHRCVLGLIFAFGWLRRGIGSVQGLEQARTNCGRVNGNLLTYEGHDIMG